MAKLLKLRRGTTSQHSSFTGAEGECTVDTTKDTLVVHDNSTAGGRALLREDLNNIGTGVITAAMMGANSVDSSELVDGGVDHSHLSNDCVDGDNLADNACDSEHYTDGSIDHVHLAGDCVDGDNLADNAVDSEHYTDGSIDLAHMSSESVDEDNLYISNAGSNGQYLQKQSGNNGGLTWATVAASVRLINSITGHIVKDTASNLDIRVSGITGTVSIKYYEGSTLHATVTSQSVSSGKITTAVPAAVYDEAVGDVISVEVVNSDGDASSNRYDVQVVALPTGGTITTSGSAKIHSFTETGEFFNTIDGLSVEYLVIGGGGSAAGYDGHGGGGGAGGYQAGTLSHVDAGSYEIRVGAGAPGGNYNHSTDESAYNRTYNIRDGQQGGLSSFHTIISLGGGRGGGGDVNTGGDGGSGGGAMAYNNAGSGTAGQGNDGGGGSGSGNYQGGGGGGGAGAAGSNGSNQYGGAGGAGTASSITGSSVTRAGGGGGSVYWGTAGGGGSGGGGSGKNANQGNGGDGTANTGSGGGAVASLNSFGGNGGSGVVILKYTP